MVRIVALAVAALLVTSSASAVARQDKASPVVLHAGAGEVREAPSTSSTSAVTPPTSPPMSTTTTARATVPPTPAPAPVPTTIAPRPAPSPQPAAKPPSGTPGTFPLAGPVPPGVLLYPYEAGRTAWSGVSNGITVSVAIDPPAPRVGDSVRFHVEASAGDLACCGFSIVYGDGGVTRPAATEFRNGECVGTVPGTASADYTHVYNRPGRWEFGFQAATGACGTNATYGVLRAYVGVEVGTPTSQGPALPKVLVAEARAPGQAVVAGALEVHADGTDEDGFVTRLVIDFGDGSAPVERPGDPMGCRPTDSGWPAASRGWTMAPYPTHRYEARGSYTITAAVISTGCDGSGTQSATASFTYMW
ncbi:MAG: hypothetical protein ACR2MO_05800 [Acidimicrobiales bacterium]